MSDLSLIEMIDKYVKEKNFTLPVFDRVALKLREITSNNDYSMHDIEQTIKSDPALASEVLKAANSPF